MTLERDGLFDVSVHKILVEAELQPETIFQCLLAIPGTSFSAKADSMYLKGQGLKAFWSSTTTIIPNSTFGSTHWKLVGLRVNFSLENGETSFSTKVDSIYLKEQGLKACWSSTTTTQSCM